jgi:hypothetical protein
MKDIRPTLTLSYKSGEREITMIFDGDDTWPEHFMRFRNFLNGVGYEVPGGSWMPDEEEE